VLNKAPQVAGYFANVRSDIASVPIGIERMASEITARLRSTSIYLRDVETFCRWYLPFMRATTISKEKDVTLMANGQ